MKLSALQDGITTVFHTASPIHQSRKELHYRINIDGTKAVISACKKTGIQCLVYTSSTAAVWQGQVVQGSTEAEMPLVETAWDHYGFTKARAEAMVIRANDIDGLRTCAIRPCGMFG